MENVVLAIGDVGFAIILHAQLWCKALVAQPALCCLPSEGNDFDGHGKDRAELVHDLARIHRYQHAAASHGDDLLAKQRAAVALDQMKGSALHLVRPVDREVELRLACEVGEWNAEGLCLTMGLDRGSDRDDVQTLANAASDLIDDQRR